MPIDSQHPKYKDRYSQWTKCRDAFEGEDAIKLAGVKYLPKLKGQTDDDYKSYKNRALFYSITSKSVSALVGMATSKAPKLEYNDSMSVYFNDSRMIQFSEVYSNVLTEVLLPAGSNLGCDQCPAVTEEHINLRPCGFGRLHSGFDAAVGDLAAAHFDGDPVPCRVADVGNDVAVTGVAAHAASELLVVHDLIPLFFWSKSHLNYCQQLTPRRVFCDAPVECLNAPTRADKDCPFACWDVDADKAFFAAHFVEDAGCGDDLHGVAPLVV